jgi:hypothetical protein
MIRWTNLSRSVLDQGVGYRLTGEQLALFLGYDGEHVVEGPSQVILQSG